MFCPNDPSPKVKELVKMMAYSGQEILTLLMIGQYKYEVSTKGLKLRRFSKSVGAQTELVGRIAQSDLMRLYHNLQIAGNKHKTF